MPEGAFERALATGQFVLVFDGLDELLDVPRRQEMSTLLENFAHRFPQARIVVTSRAAGYSEAQLDPDLFASAFITPFDNDQVGEYVRRWFALESDALPDTIAMTAQTPSERIDRFLKESEEVAELRSNPLLLALMCLLYAGKGTYRKTFQRSTSGARSFSFGSGT